MTKQQQIEEQKQLMIQIIGRIYWHGIKDSKEPLPDNEINLHFGVDQVLECVDKIIEICEEK